MTATILRISTKKSPKLLSGSWSFPEGDQLLCRRAIVETLTSKEWNIAVRLINPLSNLKRGLRTTFGTITNGLS